jgi:hypothetical protein
MLAAKAKAVIGPTPGTVISNWQAASLLASARTSCSRRLISRFCEATLANSGSMIASTSHRSSKADRTRSDSLPEPLGKPKPKAPRSPRIVFSVSRFWRTR